MSSSRIAAFLLLLCGCSEPGPWSPAELVARDEEGLTRLHRAARDGDLRTLTALLTQGAKCEARDPRDRTALHWAAIGGHARVVEELLDAGARLEARSWYDLRPLHWAAMLDRAAVMDVLIARGAELGATDFYGRTPLHLAASATAVKLLLAVGAPVEATDHEGMTPLHWVRTEGGAKALIDVGANAAIEARDGRRPIDMVIAANDDGPQELLIFPSAGQARVRGATGQLTLALASVTERTLEAISLTAESHAVEVDLPEPLAALNPGQVAEVELGLRRLDRVEPGEHLLRVKLFEGDRRRAEVELRVDTRTHVTPEDRGMTRVGTVQVQSTPGGLQWLAYVAVPLVLLAGWAIARWRRRNG